MVAFSFHSGRSSRGAGFQILPPLVFENKKSTKRIAWYLMVAGAGFEPYDLRVILALLVVMLRSTRSPPSGFVHLRCSTFASAKA